MSILGLFADVDVDEDGVWDSQDDCLDASACNYLASPTEPCGYLDALGECGGACEGDGDGDGICDDVDTCVGELDECGVCNGPGPTEVVIEDNQTLYSFRHTGAIDVFQRTGSLTKLQQVMGHSNMTVSLGYLRNLELPTLTMEDMPVLNHG